MADVRLTVRNPSGLHARPAALFVRSAASFDADIRVTNLTRDPDKAAPAGSLLAVLALGVSRGHEIRISAEGAAADEALAALTELVEGGLGEPADAGGPEG
jgi:phosphotransferase system HPr (HPr) family protein